MPKTIAISRKRGSGGSYVGRLVAERLKFRYIDRELLRSAAEYLHTSSNETPTRAETQSWLDRLAQSFALGGPESTYAPPAADGIYEGELFDIERRLIEEICCGDDSVIVGRGAAQTLRGRPGVVTVFLHAPETWRVARVQDVYHLDRRAAQQSVLASDRERTRFVRALCGSEWGDACCYELAIDIAAVGLEGAAELIAHLADQSPSGTAT